MSSSRLVRGAKTRMFACICLMCVLGALVYVFHGTQTRLADVQKIANDCNQQQESLSAQLQVIFEYKLRLEKSLKKEKADHEATKENCKLWKKEEMEAREKEKAEALSRYETLLQQKRQLEEDKEALERTIATLKDEKSRLEVAVHSAKDEMQVFKSDKDAALESLKSDQSRLEESNKQLLQENNDLKAKALPGSDSHFVKENSALKEHVQELENSLKNCKENEEVKKKQQANQVNMEQQADNSNAIEAPKFLPSGNSTTPGINPDALYSPDLSSPKPLSQRKQDEQVLGLPPKKSTQESGGEGMPALVGQIPGPPGPAHHPPQLLGPQNPIEEKRRDAAIEEDDLKQKEIPRGGRDYHGGDYDKEQPEEEEGEDEGEQLDYVQANDHIRKDPMRQAQNHQGIMVNPK